MADHPGFEMLGRLLLLFGAVLVGAGLLLLAAGRIPWLGRLPGDLVFRSGKVTVFVPIATCVVLSLFLTLVLNLLLRR
jgi:hypothetical protein